ncbi:MAG: hypothetical protein ACI9QV_000076 [Methylophagaceae bacterium]|jgi:hypothetical protein
MNTKSSTHKPTDIQGQVKQGRDSVPSIYSERTTTNLSQSSTPSWRKPDPRQWRYK